jgi:predicted O-methyltransferase YrrM
MIYGALDSGTGPSDYLIDLGLRAANEARTTHLPELSERVRPPCTDFTPIWPGEHYRLLAALVKLLQPMVVVEIGTLHGLSALALKTFLPKRGQVTTFDIVPWTAFPETCFRQEDFDDNRLQQQIGDLAKPSVFDVHRNLMEQADLLFIDGPKDGVFERELLRNLETTKRSKSLLVIFDDIRVWNMLAIWHEIGRPKLDVTSFGHWSGTGFVEWKPVNH